MNRTIRRLSTAVGSSRRPDGVYSRATTSLPMPIGFAIVPQQKAYVVQRFGKFQRILQPGLHFMVPIIDRVSYVHSLKEEAIPIVSQQAITKDNVTIGIDGVLYLRIVDPFAASYGVEDPIFAVSQIAQTTMRSELGRMKLDETFQERDMLNESIVKAINKAAEPWGLTCLRYEIRDITPPASVRAAMDTQAEAERRKRAEILQSEGERQSEMNRAEGERAAVVMRAEAEAETIRTRATAAASTTVRGQSRALHNLHVALRLPRDEEPRMEVAEGQEVKAVDVVSHRLGQVLRGEGRANHSVAARLPTYVP